MAKTIEFISKKKLCALHDSVATLWLSFATTTLPHAYLSIFVASPVDLIKKEV